MNKGDRVRLKGGTEATITRLGLGDFPGDPFPVYLTTDKGEAVLLMSYELKPRKTETTQSPEGQ